MAGTQWDSLQSYIIACSLSPAYKVTRSRTLTSPSREQAPSLTHSLGRWMRSADGPFVYGDGGGGGGNMPNTVMMVTEMF